MTAPVLQNPTPATLGTLATEMQAVLNVVSARLTDWYATNDTKPNRDARLRTINAQLKELEATARKMRKQIAKIVS